METSVHGDAGSAPIRYFVSYQAGALDLRFPPTPDRPTLVFYVWIPGNHEIRREAPVRGMEDLNDVRDQILTEIHQAGRLDVEAVVITGWQRFEDESPREKLGRLLDRHALRG